MVALPQSPQRGIVGRLPRFFIHNGEYALERLSFRLGLLPSG